MNLFGNRQSSNPMFRDDVLDNFSGDRTQNMSVQGTVNKTLILLAITVLSAMLSWKFMIGLGSMLMPVLFGTMILGAIMVFYTFKNPHVAHITAPIYAVIEGLVVGVASVLYGHFFEGIVMKAALLTFGVLFLMLFIYKSGIIKVTERFRMIMFAAIGAIALLYLTTWILHFVGIDVPFMHDGSPLAIGISIAIIIVASLSFLLDFDMIEKSVERGAPKAMEWVGGMALLVTIVWLYLEFLRLLSYLQD